eukprot:SAG31_NODE_11456_length_1028_cov_0.967707_1_plen_107_part_00
MCAAATDADVRADNSLMESVSLHDGWFAVPQPLARPTKNGLQAAPPLKKPTPPLGTLHCRFRVAADWVELRMPLPLHGGPSALRDELAQQLEAHGIPVRHSLPEIH